MSSPAAGKFQDHYEVLGVDHKAASEAIQAAYARLTDKYHPNTGTAPDADKYESVTLAFEVLSDPALRIEFDKLKGIGGDEKPRFSGASFFEAYGRDTHLRVALLCVLYDRRRTKPFTPALSMRHLEALMAANTVELNFALWYLKQKEMVMMDDKSSMQITTDGMDYLQAHPPEPADVMRLIRPAAVAGASPEVKPVESATPVASSVPAEVEATPSGSVASSVASLASSIREESAPLPDLPVTVPAEEAPANASQDAMKSTAARIGSLLAKRK